MNYLRKLVLKVCHNWFDDTVRSNGDLHIDAIESETSGFSLNVIESREADGAENRDGATSVLRS